MTRVNERTMIENVCLDRKGMMQGQRREGCGEATEILRKAGQFVDVDIIATRKQKIRYPAIACCNHLL